MDRLELAWAAGFFDGDGWAAAAGNRARRQPQARINQAGAAMPEVLIRFQAAVGGAGHLGGPYRHVGRQDLWWWTASSRPDVERVYASLAPWLCTTKASQLQIALGRQPYSLERLVGGELAWASGFFDAEGSVVLLRHRSHEGYFVCEANITQRGDANGSEQLSRFLAAVAIGKIFGPFADGRGQPRIYRWKAHRHDQIARTVALLSPKLGSVKRDQADRALTIVLAQPQLPRGNPAWGSHKTHCIHGHEYASARLHRFTARRGGSPARDSGQCLVCARDSARVRRYQQMELESREAALQSSGSATY